MERNASMTELLLTENMPTCIFKLRKYMAVTSGYGHPFRLGTIKIQRS